MSFQLERFKTDPECQQSEPQAVIKQLCYFVSPSYGVKLCYGVSPCYGVLSPLRGSHGLSARRAQRTKSKGPKGLQLEVGSQRGP